MVLLTEIYDNCLTGLLKLRNTVILMITNMNIHCFQHVPFEGPGYIIDWVKSHGHAWSYTHFYEEDYEIPPLHEIDALIIMGGPMSVYDGDQYPWLTAEKQYIRTAIAAGKNVMGICLGAQLIAQVLGAAVKPALNREIGWFAIEPTEEAGEIPWLQELFEAGPVVFHWHADQFEIPDGAVNMASSLANKNQAFAVGSQVLGLQFHLEVMDEGFHEIIDNIDGGLMPGNHIQDKQALEEGLKQYGANSNRLCGQLLANFLKVQ